MNTGKECSEMIEKHVKRQRDVEQEYGAGGVGGETMGLTVSCHFLK